jgi:hypothetical protein
MGTTANAVTSTISKPWNYVCTIQPQDRTHLQQTTAVVEVIVNLRMGTTVVTSTTQSISAGVLLDRSHKNGHLAFLTKDKPMMCPYSKRLVLQSWNTSNGISQNLLSQGGAELLKYADSRDITNPNMADIKQND